MLKGSGKRNDNQLKHARELTEKDLKEAVENYIAVFSAEPWNIDQLTVPQIYRICVIHDGDEDNIGYFSNGLIVTNEKKIGYSLGFCKPLGT